MEGIQPKVSQSNNTETSFYPANWKARRQPPDLEGVSLLLACYPLNPRDSPPLPSISKMDRDSPLTPETFLPPLLFLLSQGR